MCKGDRCECMGGRAIAFLGEGRSLCMIKVLELLVEEYQGDGTSLPKPKTIAKNLLFA
ncbi:MULTISPECIES: hypothetical protein [unclassified Microcoleus]|uniref:hypothetical protein n=1 Tax=unclassified Microcoleus TaxID=2642155 RepID=UPI0025D93302|nr:MULTISPECIES: hypothetical protein [unclassified Microcoleus]